MQYSNSQRNPRAANRLNGIGRTRGIAVLLITHEMDIAEHATRIMSCRDGRVQADRAVTNRRLASEEMSQLAAA